MPRPLRALRDRVVQSIDTSAGVDACHPWTGRTDDNGYGRVSVKSGGEWSVQYAHRVAYLEFIGPIELGRMIRHRCNNPPCCNPRHLIPGTQVDNMADRKYTGAGYTEGEENPNGTIPADVVDAIRREYVPRKHGAGTPALSRKYGVSTSQISRIVHGKARVNA